MRIQISGCNRATSSLFPNGSPSNGVGQGGRGSRRVALKRVSLASMLVLGTSLGVATNGAAQTPTSPPAQEGQQPGQQGQQPAETHPPQPVPPQTTPQQAPLQQSPIQQPGRPLITPATPPTTTVPPWTPPVPPAPSQTNVPSPFPYATPGAAPGTPGFVGIPNLAVPGAFAPTLTTVRGATLEFHPTARASLEYSDNFFQSSSHAEDNFRSILGPGFTLLLNGARTFGVLSATVDLVHDTASNSGDEIKVFPSLNLGLRYLLTPRLALTLTDTFIRNDSATTADQFGIRRGRQTFNTNTLCLTVYWLIDQVATQAYYRNVLFFNENDGQSGQTNNQSGQTNNQNGQRNNQNDTITHILGLNAGTRFASDYLVRGGYELSYADTVSGSGGKRKGGEEKKAEKTTRRGATPPPLHR